MISKSTKEAIVASNRREHIMNAKKVKPKEHWLLRALSNPYTVLITFSVLAALLLWVLFKR